jgi:hypothetical protein
MDESKIIGMVDVHSVPKSKRSLLEAEDFAEKFSLGKQNQTEEFPLPFTRTQCHDWKCRRRKQAQP